VGKDTPGERTAYRLARGGDLAADESAVLCDLTPWTVLLQTLDGARISALHKA